MINLPSIALSTTQKLAPFFFLLVSTFALSQSDYKEFNWGTELPSGPNSPLYNAILLISPYDIATEQFSYYTGGQSNGDSKTTLAPNNIVARSSFGSINVQVLSFPTSNFTQTDEDALAIAKVASAATSEIWPGGSIDVEIEVNYMPENANYRLAKQVDWQAGQPFQVSIFARPSPQNPDTATHELYHVLAARWSKGSKSNVARLRPKATLVLEEATAGLYSTCGEILVKESMISERSKARIIYNGREFDGPLDDDEIVFVLDKLARDTLPQVFGYILIETVLDRIFESKTELVLNSLEGESLITLCKQVANNPLRLETWLFNLITSKPSEDFEAQ